MYNFGKFYASKENVEVNGDVYKNIIFMRNEAGDDLVDVLKANLHPFYIAVDDTGIILSMESDPEAIQIADFDIIGIDSDYGFTRGEGGTVYGKIWDGEAIVDVPEPDSDGVMPDLTARQFWQAALVLDVTEEGLLASIADPDDTLYIEDEAERLEVSIDIRKATSFRRNYPLIDDMAAAHSIPPEQMDSLWAWAAQIE